MLKGIEIGSCGGIVHTAMGVTAVVRGPGWRQATPSSDVTGVVPRSTVSVTCRREAGFAIVKLAGFAPPLLAPRFDRLYGSISVSPDRYDGHIIEVVRQRHVR